MKRLVLLGLVISSFGMDCQGRITSLDQARIACDSIDDSQFQTLLVILGNAHNEGDTKAEVVNEFLERCQDTSGASECTQCTIVTIDYIWGP